MKIKIILLLVFIFMVIACGNTSLKQTGYETMQNIKKQQCDRSSNPESCDERESYDSYRDKTRKNK